MPRLKSAWIANAYEWYTDWLWSEFGYSRDWQKHLPEMYLYYTIAGIGRAPVAEFVLAAVRRNPKRPRFQDTKRNSLKQAPPRWAAGKDLAKEICVHRQTNPVSWFTDITALHCRWEYLQKFHGVRAKIASLIMRDLSFLRDFSAGSVGVRSAYSNRRHQQWFDGLNIEDQALFVPIDIRVHEYARKYGASTICAQCPAAKIHRIQSDPARHREAAAEIVRWARAHGHDPRELDVYWYGRGSEQIREDGTPLS